MRAELSLLHLASPPESMTLFNQQVSTLFHPVGLGGVAKKGTGGEHWRLEVQIKTSQREQRHYSYTWALASI